MLRARYVLLLPAVACLVRPQPAGNSYVNPKLCGGCHAKIAQSYARTGMARSFSKSPEGLTLPANPFYHQSSGTYYSMAQREGELYQRRWRTGYDGKEIEARESRVDYVMGSGNHARTFLRRTERGALVELPLAWYAENGGEWAMGPGHDRPYALPPRTIAYECMFCHNAYPGIPAGSEEPGREALYSGPLPEGIDCQRCHGPGGNHVRAAQTAGASVESMRRAIVNPARLSPERQLEVCMQCHLETTSRPLPHAVVKFGRGPFSYRPGEPLGDFMVFFDRAGNKSDDEFEIVHSAYRLRQSRCFLQSSGRLTCTTCHDPHDIPRGEEATIHYNGVCGQCHAANLPKHTAQTDCVGCHMPKRRTQDVVHVVMTDHFIQRRPRPLDPRVPIAEMDADSPSGGIAIYYPASPGNALYLALAQARQKGNSMASFATAMAAQKPSRPEFYVELGQALLSAGKRQDAVAAFENAVRLAPASPVAGLNLGDALIQAGNVPRAVAVLTRSLQAAPRDALLWYQLGIAHSAAGSSAEAIAAFRKSIGLDPDLTEAHNLLGAALAAGGDLDRSEKELRQALEINPDYPDAQGNLGHLLAARGQLAEAAFYLARASQLKPNDAEIRTNYAVTLAGLNRLGEARQQIDAALQGDPKSPEAHNFKGTLLEHSGNLAEALAEFLEAARLEPDFDRAHFNAGRLLAAKGEFAAAIQQLRQAANSDDANLQRQAAALLQQIQNRR